MRATTYTQSTSHPLKTQFNGPSRRIKEVEENRQKKKKKCGNAQPLAPARRGRRTRGCEPEVATSRRPTPDKAAAASAGVFPEPPRRPRKMSQPAPAFIYGLRGRLFSLIPSQTVALVRYLRERGRGKMEEGITYTNRSCEIPPPWQEIVAKNRKSKQGKNK